MHLSLLIYTSFSGESKQQEGTYLIHWSHTSLHHFSSLHECSQHLGSLQYNLHLSGLIAQWPPCQSSSWPYKQYSWCVWALSTSRSVWKDCSTIQSANLKMNLAPAPISAAEERQELCWWAFAPWCAEKLWHLWLEAFSSICPNGEGCAWTPHPSQPKVVGFQVSAKKVTLCPDADEGGIRHTELNHEQIWNPNFKRSPENVQFSVPV